jgi:hypothetical protein
MDIIASPCKITTQEAERMRNCVMGACGNEVISWALPKDWPLGCRLTLWLWQGACSTEGLQVPRNDPLITADPSEPPMSQPPLSLFA